MGCTNLPPAVLNARIQVTGNIADYVCQDGFEMTSGTQRATCTGPNTWSFGTSPVCTVIDKTIYQNTLPVWVPIVVAVLLTLIVLICIIIVIVYCCCGPGRCAGKNKTKPSDEDVLDDSYYDNRKLYETKDYHDNGYYNDGYSYRRNNGGPYVVPIDYRKQQKIQNREYVQYVMVEQQQQSKQKQQHQQQQTQQPQKLVRSPVPNEDVVNLVQLPNGQFVPLDKKMQNKEYVQYVMVEPQQKSKPKQQPPQAQKVVRSPVPNEDVVSLVQLTNGHFVPLHKYLQDNPCAKVSTMGDKDVVYVQEPGQKPESRAPVRHAWRANNKRTPPRPAVRAHTIAQPVVVTVMNDLTDEELALEEKTQKTRRRTPPHQQPQQQQPHVQPTPVIVTVPGISAPGRAPNEDTYIYKPTVKKDQTKRGKDTKSPDTKTDKETSNHSQDETDGSGDAKVKDTANDNKDDDSERKDTSDSMEPIRAQYVRSGTDLDTSGGDSDVFITTPPHSTKHEIKRPAFTVRDYNRFRPAKDFPAWRPHAKPIRDNNTSTQ